jgi:hypothetical protein
VLNPRVFGEQWDNASVVPTSSSHSILGRRLLQLDHDDQVLHSLNFSLPYAFEYLGHQVLENLHYDSIHNETEWVHPLSFAAKASSLDSPSLKDIPCMPIQEMEQWYDAMDIEIKALHDKKTMVEIPCRDVPKGKQIIKSTWAFWKKRRPSGEVYKLKACFCVRGNLQTLVESQSTFSPVVSWSTVQLLFVITVTHKLKSTTIDFNNELVQSPLPEPIHLELPPGYVTPDSRDLVYKVSKSLYGDIRAAKLWYTRLQTILIN